MARHSSKMPSVGGVQLEPSFIDELKSVLNLNQVKKTFRLGNDLFEAVHGFIEKPTWWNAGAALAGIGKVFVDDVEMYADSYFDGDDWVSPYSRDFNQTILDVLAHFPYQVLKTSDESDVVRIVDMGTARAGWVFNTKMHTVDHIYVEQKNLQQARATIKQLLWDKFKDQPLVMRQNRRMIIGADEAKVVFEVDDAFRSLPSKKASEYAQYLKRCLDAGVSRSVMLYGPPGTGKSTMARTLVENLNLRSFRIRVEDVSGLENSTLFEAISIFEPDAVILDDFDRASGQSALLETLEFFQHNVKLVVATVNDKEQLDEALLRPGRFDELVLVDRMDDEVIKHVLGDFVDGFEDVKTWPIAFIQEYVKRRKFMSPEEAANSTEELARRVKRLECYRDASDVEHMLKVMGKRSGMKLPTESDAEFAERLDQMIEEATAPVPDRDIPLPDLDKVLKKAFPTTKRGAAYMKRRRRKRKISR